MTMAVFIPGRQRTACEVDGEVDYVFFHGMRVVLDYRESKGFPESIGEKYGFVSQIAAAGVTVRFLGTSSVVKVGGRTERNEMCDVGIVGISHSMSEAQVRRHFSDDDTDRAGADKLSCRGDRVTEYSDRDYSPIMAHQSQPQQREGSIRKTSCTREYVLQVQGCGFVYAV